MRSAKAGFGSAGAMTAYGATGWGSERGGSDCSSVGAVVELPRSRKDS